MEFEDQLLDRPPNPTDAEKRRKSHKAYLSLPWHIARNILAVIGSIWVVLTIYFVLFYND